MKTKLLILLAAILPLIATAQQKKRSELTTATPTGTSLFEFSLSDGGSGWLDRKASFNEIKAALSLQPLDSDLTAIAALATTSFGRSLLTESAANGASQLVRLNGSGQLPAIDGSLLTGLSSGFANPMTTLGDFLYGGASGAATRLAGNTTTTRRFLSQVGNGTISAAPTLAIIGYSDISGAVTGSGSAFGSNSSSFNGLTYVSQSYLEFTNLGAAPATPTGASRLYFDSSNRLSWKGTNGFVRTFDGTANTADRIYVLPDVAGTVVLDGSTATLTNKTINGAIINNATYPVSAQSGTAFDFSGDPLKTYTLAANTTFTTSNLAAGKSITVKITGGASIWTTAFPAWKFIGATAPTSVAIGKVGILTVTSFGTTDANCVAAWSVEP